MSQSLPKEFEICFTREQIAARVSELAEEIIPWVQNAEKRTGQPALLVCVLRGAVFFFADLLREIPISVEPAFCRTWAYTTDSQLMDKIKISNEDLEVRGRAVLIVDDICDSGATLEALQAMYSNQGAVEVRSVVAVHRQIAQARHNPAWAAFLYTGSEWFVGYGMDSGEKFRNLADIYRIRK